MMATAEEMLTAFEELSGTQEEAPEEPQDDPEVPEPEPEEPEPSEEPAAEERPAADFASERRAQLAEQWLSWLDEDPTRLNLISSWHNGERVLVPKDEYETLRRTRIQPAPEAEPEPEWSEYDDDPRLKALYQQQQELKQQYAEMERRDKTRDIERSVKTGIDQFLAANPKLSEDDKSAITRVALQNKLLEAAVRDAPPEELVDKSIEALEMARRYVMFDRQADTATEKTAEDMRTRRRAAAAGRGRGNVSRTITVPTSGPERDAAAIAFFAEALNE